MIISQFVPLPHKNAQTVMTCHNNIQLLRNRNSLCWTSAYVRSVSENVQNQKKSNTVAFIALGPFFADSSFLVCPDLRARSNKNPHCPKQGHPCDFWHLGSQQSLSEQRPLRGLWKREDCHQYRSIYTDSCPSKPQKSAKYQE